MRHRIALFAYLAAVLGISLLHDPLVLAACLIPAFLLAWRDLPRLLKRSVLALALFNIMISGSYIFVSELRHEPWAAYLLLMNLRVFLLTFLAFLLSAKVDLWQALSFSRGLSTMLILASSQAQAFRRLFAEFNLALKSRSPVRPGLRDLYRQAAAVVTLFLRRALQDMTEIGQAMEARGFHIDRR